MSSPCCASKPAPQIKDLDALTSVYAALADPTRLRILSLLGEDEICVCHLHASLDVPQPTASRHLAYLRKSGLVEARRDGIWMHYRLAPIENPVVAVRGESGAPRADTHRDQRQGRTTVAGRAEEPPPRIALRQASHDHRAVRLRAQCRALADRRCPLQQIRGPRKSQGHFGGYASCRPRPSRSRRRRCRRAGSIYPAQTPQQLTPELASTASWLITMGCGDECPVVPGTRRADWPIQDPKGQAPSVVDGVIHDVDTRVRRLIDEQGWR